MLHLYTKFFGFLAGQRIEKIAQRGDKRKVQVLRCARPVGTTHAAPAAQANDKKK